MEMYICPTCSKCVSKDDMNFDSGMGLCNLCVKKGIEIKWPGLFIESTNFKSLPAPQKLHQLAYAYLNSAKVLCDNLGGNPEKISWPGGCVAYFCLHHSIELFLKACILLRAPSGEKLHHDISKLQDRYCELYPDIKNDFHIETPWDLSFEKIENILNISIDLEDFERKPDQVYRYMTGKKGESIPKGIGNFAPGMFLFLCERMETDFSRVWKKIN